MHPNISGGGATFRQRRGAVGRVEVGRPRAFCCCDALSLPYPDRYLILPRHAVLIACVLALAGLVYAEGWIWQLKAAAVMIPVSFLVS
jgi:hypothetical protein